ncbi:hypothetical protein STAS_33816 [Striga asiatica]|uniref:Uncharacterized protein n=1 Tax=Striga asiatica TaxID=4170 RepID=A0A5A7RFZ6_STRAF|nr:hypothetical protein STAS_33816 [Striga asiatica]
MAARSLVSINLINKNILPCSSASISPLLVSKIPRTNFTTAQFAEQRNRVFSPSRIKGRAQDPTYHQENLPPEIPTPPTEMPQRPNVPEIGPTPPEMPADPPPLSPGPNPGPEFPNPPDLIPPKPEAPRPPMPSPPEIVPPDVTPPKSPEPSPPYPDDPPLMIGSDGLAFY